MSEKGFYQITTTSGGDTFSLTYIVSIPVEVPPKVTPKQLKLAKDIGEIRELEVKSKKNIIKSVHINIEQLLEGMDGVEVSEII